MFVIKLSQEQLDRPKGEEFNVFVWCVDKRRQNTTNLRFTMSGHGKLNKNNTHFGCYRD